MDSTLKEIKFVTPQNKYRIFYYKIPVSFVSSYVINRWQPKSIVLQFEFRRLAKKCSPSKHNKLRNEIVRVLVGTREGKNHMEDLGVDRRVTLQFILKKQGGGRGLD
jgi:hypothetical protein